MRLSCDVLQKDFANTRLADAGFSAQKRDLASVGFGSLRDGVARILRSANFRIVASVSCADDFLSSKVQLHHPLFLIVHIGDDFDVVTEQIELLRRSNPGGRIAIVADRYRLKDVASAFRTGANGYFVEVMTSDVFNQINRTGSDG